MGYTSTFKRRSHKGRAQLRQLVSSKFVLNQKIEIEAYFKTSTFFRIFAVKIFALHFHRFIGGKGKIDKVKINGMFPKLSILYGKLISFM